MKISIAMATFNGEKYIAEQLQSLADQSHLPFELVIGDDGSSDSTLDIIKDFRAHAPFSVHIHQNETNLGFARNFLATAKRCKGDWIAFCDQDDFWLPGKLAKTVDAICHTPNCSMVLQNALICDKALNSRGRKFPNKLKASIHDPGHQYGFWVWIGCLQTVHRDIIGLWDECSLPRNYFPNHAEISHDKWTCMIANALGGIAVLGNPTALYRRHETALTGDYNQKSVHERMVKARGVSGDHYEFLADVAKDYAGYMKGLADRTNKPAWASKFRINSKEFEYLSEIQRLRGRLYTGPRFRERLTTYMQIAARGGYLGQPFHAMGMRSAVKDVVRVVAGSRL